MKKTYQNPETIEVSIRNNTNLLAGSPNAGVDPDKNPVDGSGADSRRRGGWLDDDGE